MPLVECVPVITASRPDITDALVTVVKKVKGAKVLHQSSDVALNRTLLTLAGDPVPLAEAAFRLIIKARAMIDQPADTLCILPFVPLRDITLEECAELARKLGQRVGENLPLPVYLYGDAATRPEHTRLAQIQRDAPDFGTLESGTSGAIFIGARQMAFTLYIALQTENLTIAEEIARKISTGAAGLPGVEAEALLLRNKVLIVLTVGGFIRFPRLPLPHIIALIQSEAEQRGTTIVDTELIGLIPQHGLTSVQLAAEANMVKFTIFPDAFLKKSARMVRLRNLTRDRLLEAALRKARLQ